jgi:hypothetical protein
MLRELPDTELPDDGDYERWYFEGQRAAKETKGRQGEGVGEELTAHRPSERDTKRGRRSALSQQEILVTLLPWSEPLMRRDAGS